MKVIKRGNAPPPKVYRVTCDYCATELEFDEYDSLARFSKGEPGCLSRPGSTIVSVNCPVCRTTVSTDA